MAVLVPIALAPVTMPSEGFIIDPTTEDAANVQLSVNDGTSFKVIAAELPPPPRASTFASSADTEGDPLVQHRYQNREITLKLRVYGASVTALHTNLDYLQQKVGKINREGGTLKWTSLAPLDIVFDLLGAEIDVVLDQAFGTHKRTEATLKFQAMPFGRGPEVTHADNITTTLPYLSFTVGSIAGDVPALGRLVVDNDQAADQFWMVWGQQSRYYDASANASLFYEAESRTAQGGSATNVGAGSPSGGSVMRNTDLTTSYQSILSTQATGAGAHLQHVGDYQVFARLYRPTGNTGAVSVAFEWAEGDFKRVTPNPPVDFAAGDREVAWVLADLGQVHLTKVVTGTQRWEGRVLAKSTIPGDEIDVDYLLFVPVTEGAGRATGSSSFPTPTTFGARDEFDQSAGALAGKTLVIGGTWAGAGDADDFAVETTGKTAQRTAVSDSNGWANGRFAIAGTSTTFNASIVEFKHSVPTAVTGSGAVARYTDTSNFALAYALPSSTGTFIALGKMVSGSQTTLTSTNVALIGASTLNAIHLEIDTAGRASVYFYLPGSMPTLVLQTTDAVFATGGALASGKVGFWDQQVFATANTRNYDNFRAYTLPTTDQAIHASQSLEVRHDRCIRESSAGSVWSPVGHYEGSYLRPLPAGREGRTARFIVKASRGAPDTGTDSSIDDISAQLYTTPRYLVVPA